MSNNTFKTLNTSFEAELTHDAPSILSESLDYQGSIPNLALDLNDSSIDDNLSSCKEIYSNTHTTNSYDGTLDLKSNTFSRQVSLTFDEKESQSSSEGYNHHPMVTTSNTMIFNNTSLKDDFMELSRGITPPLEPFGGFSKGNGKNIDDNGKESFKENELYENKRGEFYELKRTKKKNDWVCTEFVPTTINKIIGDSQPYLHDEHQFVNINPLYEPNWYPHINNNRYYGDNTHNIDPDLSLYAAKYQNNRQIPLPVPLNNQKYVNSLIPNEQQGPYYIPYNSSNQYYYDYNKSDVEPSTIEYQNKYFV